MAADTFLTIGGVILIALTLADVFETVLAPGGSRAWLKVVRRTVLLLLPIWKRLRPGGRGISGMFAPIVLVVSFVVWVSFLGLGFGAVIYALRSNFEPPLSGFWDAVYFAGSAIVTIGLSETDATGGARFVVLAAGLCGLAVITLAVTYFLLVLNSVASRDTGILKLNTCAGRPPSALTLLETTAQLRLHGELPRIMADARDWCLTVRQSHATHPSLIYFESIGSGTGWPATLGALVDLALIAELWLDDDTLYGPAVLLRMDAVEMASELAALVRLKPALVGTTTSVMEAAAARLTACGYRLKPELDLQAAAQERSRLQGAIAAMADHLGKPAPRLDS